MIKDLQRLMEKEQSTAESNSKEMQELLKKLRDRPFYIWSNDKHRLASDPRNTIKGRCCFNDIIGRPIKNGIPQPLWNYQDMIYRALMFPGYINSAPTTGLGLSHNIKEKKEKENLKQDQYFYDFKLKHLWIKKA